MTKEKVREVISRYRLYFIKLKINKEKFPHLQYCITFNALNHCNAMLDDMEKFVEEDRMDKVYRWLGFVQGVLWVMRIYTLEELKNHNKKD